MHTYLNIVNMKTSHQNSFKQVNGRMNLITIDLFFYVYRKVSKVSRELHLSTINDINVKINLHSQRTNLLLEVEEWWKLSPIY